MKLKIQNVTEKPVEPEPIIAETPVIQPPLPLDPPPPDSPPPANVSPKKEIIEETKLSSPLSPEINAVIKTEKLNDDSEIVDIKTKRAVCRDFLRNSCTKDNNCRFRHKLDLELDLSELHRLYIFCKDYQNSICTYPNCRFVHASVFEEERFYRTGILPPNALSHQKKPESVNNNTITNNSNTMYINPIEKNFLLLPPPPPPPLPANGNDIQGDCFLFYYKKYVFNFE